MWRKKHTPDAEDRLKRADEAVAKSTRDAEQTQELRNFIGDAMAYLARLNQENSFAKKMELAYGPQPNKKVLK